MSPVEEIQTLCQAFLTLFAEADKEIEISANKKILASKVLGIMQKYTLMPGKMIQNCRNIIDFILQKKVSTNSAKQSQELISKLSQIKILEADRTGALLIFYDYLKASLDYFWVYNRNRGSTRNLSSTPSKKEKSDKTPKNLAELDEALEISREILKQSINSMSSQRNKLKSNSSEFRSLITQNSFISKSDSIKSISVKNSFDVLIEDKFKEFLKNKNFCEYSSVSSRILLIDEFETEIRNGIRQQFLLRVCKDSFLNELKNETLNK